MPADSLRAVGEGPWVVRVYGIDAAALSEIHKQFDVWGADSDDHYAVVGIRNRAELERLQALGHTVRIDPKFTERYRQPLMLGFGNDTIPNFPCYRTVEATFTTAQNIVTAQPQLAELFDIGDTWERTQNNAEGFDLWVLRLTNEAIAGPKPTLFVMSGIHARELTTAELMTRFAERLSQGYGVDADITWLLDHHEVHLLLQSNPDGRKQAEAGQLWRKNTNENYCGTTSSSRGADLNRNFPWQWGGAASTNPCGETYQGPTPASEPEVQAVVDYVRALFPDQRDEPLNVAAPLDATGVFIDVHSFSQLVLWPYGFSNSAGQAPNQPQLSTLGRRLAFFNGYRPQQILGLTAASGSTADFAYGELGVAAYAFELGTEFFQQCSTFENNILEQNIDAMLYAAKVARTPYQTPSGPEMLELELLPSAVIAGNSVTLQAQADGTRFSTVNDSTSPQEPPRQVGSVNVYIDTLPWAGPASTTASAADGAFDSAQEAVSATLSTTGLSEGQHTIFTQAIGQDGQSGAISATFLEVIDGATAARLFGSVLIQGTQIPVADARVSANQFSVFSNEQGDYSLDLPPGSYQVTVSGDNVGGSSSVNLSLGVSEQRQLDLTVLSRCDLFTDDMEAGVNGWTTTGNWAQTTEQANSPVLSWHDSPGGDYPNNQDTSLTSPLFDLSEASAVRLDFAHLCDTEDGFDFGRVEISSNGGSNWQEVYRCDNQPAWQQQSVDISSLDGSANARIRFRLVTDTAVRDNGWYIDDVRINAISPACIPDNPDLLFADGFE
ncbi:MAG: hypothetical protein Tsb002_29890 [Wenzhouxiangellaceae bacterium]